MVPTSFCWWPWRLLSLLCSSLLSISYQGTLLWLSVHRVPKQWHHQQYVYHSWHSSLHQCVSYPQIPTELWYWHRSWSLYCRTLSTTRSSRRRLFVLSLWCSTSQRIKVESKQWTSFRYTQWTNLTNILYNHSLRYYEQSVFLYILNGNFQLLGTQTTGFYSNQNGHFNRVDGLLIVSVYKGHWRWTTLCPSGFPEFILILNDYCVFLLPAL